ncbi:PrpR N-terminal domain-containing protein [Piscibacillus sp. B03]|uniref:PrpR N-terminal domain-containing protein n=1 Tax=Piscibacillus sp. B03 TaxID=3457430 RepID=UPI003FCE94AF
MRVKVKFIAPYPAMVPLVEECQADLTDLDISLEVGNLQDGVEIAKRAEADGYQIIISRGGTAQMIRKSVSLPVVDVHISGYDILRILTLAKDFSDKKALVGFPNITIGAQSIADLLEYPIDVFSIEEADDVKTLLPRLKEEGYGVILGDVITIEEANRHGMEGVLIQSGREAIYSAFNKAKNQYKYYKFNMSRIELLTERLKKHDENLILMNSKYRIIHEVWNSFDKNPLKEETLNDLAQQALTHGEISTFVEGKGGQEIEVLATTSVINNESFIVLSLSLNVTTFNRLDGVRVKTVSQKPKLVHQSDAMNEAIKVIDQSVSQHQLFVLSGEPGTGKSLFAEYIHYKTNPSNLIAVVDFKQCTFEDLSRVLSSNVKTVYFKNMTYEQKARKLELMKTFVYKSLNDDIRIVFSSKPNWLGELVLEEDQLVEVYIPSLKQRQEDFKGLVTLFVTEFHQSLGVQPVKIRDAAIQVLQNGDWLENVRELKAFIKNLVLLEKGYVIDEKVVKTKLKEKTQAPRKLPILEGTLEEIEARIIQSVLEEENFNQSKTAKRLGINRSTLWRKLNK